MARPNLTNYEIESLKRKLIDAAIYVNKKDGFNSVSIKTISSYSKINSAIIYKYFKNLDELIIYSYVDTLYNYYEEIKKINFKDLSNVEIYILTWKEFCRFSYNNKEIIDTLFFEGNEFDLDHIVSDYSRLYNKSYNISNESVLNMLSKSNLYERNLQVLRPILPKKYTKEEIDNINSLLINNFQVYLKNLISNKISISENAFTDIICDSNKTMLDILSK